MTSEQKEKLWELIKGYGEDCEHLVGRWCEGTLSECEQAQKEKESTIEKLKSFIEEL